MSASGQDHSLTLDMWAMITIQEWIRKIRELGIVNTGTLASSFEASVVTSAGGSLEKIIFAFEYYGKMVDMGVGKGVSLSTRNALSLSGFTSRRKRDWYKQFYHELAVLKYLYQEKFAGQASDLIVANFGDKK